MKKMRVSKNPFNRKDARKNRNGRKEIQLIKKGNSL